jgi:ATP-binding cassette, subfamily C, bacteriocin exporter
MIRLKMIRSSSVFQHDSSDCGVACLASVIRYLGGDSNLETLRRISGTAKSGVSLLGICHAAIRSGLNAKGYEASTDDLKCHPHVLVLHVIIEEKLSHFVVCYGYEDEKFIIWDPATGVQLMDENSLRKIWSGKCLSLYPGESFIRRDKLVSSKRKWLIKMLEPDRDMLLVSIVIGILISVLGIVMALYTQKLIDKILPSGEMKLLYVTSALVLFLLLTRIAIASLRQMLLLTQGKMFNLRVVDDFFSSIMHLQKSFFDTRKTGDFVARLNDTMRIQRVIAEIASTYIIDILVIGITITVLFYYSFSAGIISIISLPVFYLVVSTWHERIRSSQHALMAGYASSESNFIDSIKGITEIKSLNWQDSFTKNNQVIYSDFQNRIFSLGKIKVKLNLITGLAGSLYLIVLLVWSARLVMMSTLTEGELMAIISLGSSLVPSALNIALIAIPLSEVKVAINRMFEFTQMDSEKDQNYPDGKKIKIDSLEIRNLSFRYPGQKLLLDGIDLELRKGEIVSVVGESGCGKSTLASLILRFYLPESGTLRVNNRLNVSDIDIESWRSRVVIIPQEIHIFNGTILQNLIIEINDNRINELLATITELGLIPFINSFPSGLMTLVGEEGINLSGGQKQVIAFLRAFLSRPDIMIIDEGTSNMDKGTETLIMNLLVKMKAQMGIMMISHKLNMIKRLSDRICVIEDRKIITQGTHNEVVMAENFYSKTWDDFR